MEFLKRHKAAVAVAAGAAVLLAVLVAVFVFGVQTLFIDREVDEELVVTETTDQDTDPATDPSTEPAPPAAELIAEGQFVDVAHAGTGTAQLVRRPDGSGVIQFVDLAVDNGPDLRVVVSPQESQGDATEYQDGDTDIGALSGNIGNQVYEIPDGIDLDSLRSVQIWCRRFDVTFNVAAFTAQ